MIDAQCLNVFSSVLLAAYSILRAFRSHSNLRDRRSLPPSKPLHQTRVSPFEGMLCMFVIPLADQT